jgi:protein-S-isoprenylcysteine O-methyltransferase Ste14
VIPRTTGAADSANVRFPPPFLYAAAVLGGYVLDLRRPLPIVRGGSGALEIVALVVCVLGLALVASAIQRFRHYGTSLVPIEPTTAMAKDGPYRFTRNPMYLGLLILSCGLALAMNSVWTVLLLVPAVVAMNVLVIAREERYLERKFGAEYVEYKHRVRRWV